MIFLFFGTSLALLEAELAPFKDWEDIGNICSSSRHRERLLPNSRVASLKQIVIIIIKYRPYFAHFPRPGENDPYAHPLVQF